MDRVKRMLGISATVVGMLLLFAGLGVLMVYAGLAPGLPLLLVLLLLYGWVLFAYLHYRQGRQQEMVHLLSTAAESQAPLAPVLWAYLHDRPQGPLREFWTALLLFFVLPGYYWVWHRRHSFDQKVARVAYYLEMGDSLPNALRAAPGVVSPEMALAVQVGQHTGRLAYCLRCSLPRRLGAVWMEVAPRLLYPVLLFIFLTFLGAFWATVILPRMGRIFTDLNVDMPEATVRLVALTDLLRDYSDVLALGFFGLVTLIALVVASPTLRWHLPVVGRYYRRHVQGHVLKMLAVLVGAGTPVPEALALLADSGHVAGVVRRRLHRVRRRVEEGEPLADSLRRGRLLPRPLVPLVRAAERAGNLPWALAELGELLVERTIRALRRFSQFLFPLLVVGIGVLVGISVIGMFMPIIDIITKLTI